MDLKEVACMRNSFFKHPRLSIVLLDPYTIYRYAFQNGKWPLYKPKPKGFSLCVCGAEHARLGAPFDKYYLMILEKIIKERSSMGRRKGFRFFDGHLEWE